MLKRCVLFILLFSFSSLLPAQSLAELDKDQGFQNFKFGKDISEYPQVEKIDRQPGHYLVKDPTNQIIDFTAKKILIVTDESNKIKEIQVWIKTKNPDKILPSLEYAYTNSEVKYVLFNHEVYEWKGNSVGLRYQPGVRKCSFTFFKINP